MLDEVYELCKEELKKEGDKFENKVKILYDQFGYEEVSQKISEILTPASIDAEVKIIFQTIGWSESCCTQPPRRLVFQRRLPHSWWSKGGQ